MINFFMLHTKQRYIPIGHPTVVAATIAKSFKQSKIVIFLFINNIKKDVD